MAATYQPPAIPASGPNRTKIIEYNALYESSGGLRDEGKIAPRLSAIRSAARAYPDEMKKMMYSTDTPSGELSQKSASPPVVMFNGEECPPAAKVGGSEVSLKKGEEGAWSTDAARQLGGAIIVLQTPNGIVQCVPDSTTFGDEVDKASDKDIRKSKAALLKSLSNDQLVKKIANGRDASSSVQQFVAAASTFTQEKLRGLVESANKTADQQQREMEIKVTELLTDISRKAQTKKASMAKGGFPFLADYFKLKKRVDREQFVKELATNFQMCAAASAASCGSTGAPANAPGTATNVPCVYGSIDGQDGPQELCVPPQLFTLFAEGTATPESREYQKLTEASAQPNGVTKDDRAKYDGQVLSDVQDKMLSMYLGQYASTQGADRQRANKLAAKMRGSQDVTFGGGAGAGASDDSDDSDEDGDDLSFLLAGGTRRRSSGDDDTLVL